MNNILETKTFFNDVEVLTYKGIAKRVDASESGVLYWLSKNPLTAVVEVGLGERVRKFYDAREAVRWAEIRKSEMVPNVGRPRKEG